uniref:Uncharacterized protein n=1 Tax=Anguilla anguilla TaxID=7936 RepID=A0A0E9U115_ANGAN
MRKTQLSPFLLFFIFTLSIFVVLYGKGELVRMKD